jgi:hypothetical protein
MFFRKRIFQEKYSLPVLCVLTLGLLLGLAPELLSRYDLNDAVLHTVSAGFMGGRIAQLKNPLDFVIETWACSYPLFGQYQMLPHFVLAAIHLATLQSVFIGNLQHALVVLLLAVYPWSFFFALRRFGLREMQALWGAVFSLLCASAIGFGHELGSYVAYGHGLFTQLFGMALFPWALVLGVELVSGIRKRLFPPVLFSSALLLSHIFLAYFEFLLLGFFWAAGLCGRRGAALKRFVSLGALVFLTTSFFVVPMLVNAPFHAYSRYEPLAKLDSYGAGWVLSNLLKGNLFDAGRLPVLTALGIIGFVIAARRKSPELVLAAGFLFSVLLFFGRTTWGGWLRLLPLSRDMHFERFILGLHFFGAALAGIGAARIVEYLKRVRGKPLQIALVFLFALPLVGVASGTFHYLQKNRRLLDSLHRQYRSDLRSTGSLFAAIRRENPGRLYAGMRSGWGQNLKRCGVPVYFLSDYEGLASIGNLAFGWSLPGDFSVKMNEQRSDHLDLFNITHIVSWPDDGYWGRTPVYRDNAFAVYRTEASGYFAVANPPRVAVAADKYTYWNPVSRWLQSGLPAQRRFLQLCFGPLQDGDFERVLAMDDPWHYTLKMKTAAGWSESREAAFESPAPYGLLQATPPDPGRVLSQTQSEPWTAEVETVMPAVVVFKMTYHPFWRARVDGKSVKPIMVSPGFLAAPVPQGRSRVEFEYRPAWWKWALLPLLFLAPAFLAWRDRRPGGKEPDTAAGPSPLGNGPKVVTLTVLCAAGLLITHALLPQREVRLEALPPVGEQLEPAGVGQSVERVTIGGVPFDSGLTTTLSGAEPWTRLYRLDGRYRALETWVGCTDVGGSCKGNIEAVFEVRADSTLAYRSDPLKPGMEPGYVRADLAGKNLLTLIVRPTGDAGCAGAAWAGARLLK